MNWCCSGAAPPRPRWRAFAPSPWRSGLFTHGPAAFLLYKIQDVCEWSDVAFNVHLVPEAERELPREEPGDRARLRMVLVDAEDGVIRAKRIVSLDKVMTQALKHAMAEQAAAPFNRIIYDAAVQEVTPATGTATPWRPWRKWSSRPWAETRNDPFPGSPGRLLALLGPERAFFDDATRTLYASDETPRSCMPEAVLFPASHDDVAAIVSLANRHALSPWWPGAPVPATWAAPCRCPAAWW
jgi:hypothetical protein